MLSAEADLGDSKNTVSKESIRNTRNQEEGVKCWRRCKPGNMRGLQENLNRRGKPGKMMTHNAHKDQFEQTLLNEFKPDHSVGQQSN